MLFIVKKFNGAHIYFVLVLTVVAHSTLKAQDTPPPVNKNAAKTLFLKHCARCHGRKGQLSFGKIPKLKRSALNGMEIGKKIKSGGNSMPQFEKNLGPEEIRLIANYVLKLREK
ncbi:cytochrome c [Fulvivirgaceae bacterium BMA12]|uniref:Cytochrome c n=1 Tax=Agaribacillus aureus TaxID=3051825 RepID=A0ABT8L524_9BACT|nr:cytochrome c [Fulvivirgaceae bacterium BMA12]